MKMNLLKKLVKTTTNIRFESHQDKLEFLNWYLANGGATSNERYNIEHLHANGVQIFELYDKPCYISVDTGMNRILQDTWKKFKLKHKIGGIEMYDKQKLSTRHIVKLRNGTNNVVLENRESNDAIYLSLECSEFMRTRGNWLKLKEYDDNLTYKCENNQYDIVAIKEFSSTCIAYLTIINNESINWDWIRPEMTPEQLELRELEKQQREIANKMSELSERIGGLK